MPVAYQIIDGPDDEPLTVAEVKEHLREDGTGQDAIIERLISAARDMVEGMTGRVLMPCTARERFGNFPADGEIRLTGWPVREITSVVYVDDDGATQTVDDADYRSDLDSIPATINPAYGTSWPSARAVTGAVTVEYEVGSTNAAAVPVSLKQAILLLVGEWYAIREAVVDFAAKEVPLAVRSLCNRHAIFTFH